MVCIKSFEYKCDLCVCECAGGGGCSRYNAQPQFITPSQLEAPSDNALRGLALHGSALHGLALRDPALQRCEFYIILCNFRSNSMCARFIHQQINFQIHQQNQ